MMNMLGYDIKDFKQFNVPFSKTGWGVHDKDLFEQAKIEYDKLMKQQKPFNLTQRKELLLWGLKVTSKSHRNVK